MSICRKLVVSGLLSLFLTYIGAGLSADAQSASAKKPTIDLAFCIDTTGSMAGELDVVKSKTKEIVARLAGQKPAPQIRVGIVAFKDKGDDYLTKVYPFTGDIDQIVKDIQELQAVGGGDEPEAVSEALHAAVNELAWTSEKKAVKVLFLIGDAGPKQYGLSWKEESRAAIAQGIQINTIACDGLAADGDLVFKGIAKLADGTSEVLTYRQEVVNAAGRRQTIISAGGRTYAVPGDSDKWREGAGALATSGYAREIARPGAFSGRAGDSALSLTMPPTVVDSRAGLPAASFGAHTGVAGDSLYDGPARAGASRAAAMTAAPRASRGDSNLADLVIKSTQSALKKKMAE